jgi:hypothetical protein
MAAGRQALAAKYNRESNEEARHQFAGRDACTDLQSKAEIEAPTAPQDGWRRKWLSAAAHRAGRASTDTGASSTT